MASLFAPKIKVNPVNRGGDMLRALTRQASLTEAPEPTQNIERDSSESIDAINFILADLAMPSELRAFVDAVIGAASAKLSIDQSIDDWFELKDLELGRRALPDRQDEIGKASLKKWSQRQRQKFTDWQNAVGVCLIQCEPGGQDRDRNNHNSRYRAPLLKAAADALNEARTDAAWQRDRSAALASAARIALATIPNAPARRERFKRPRRGMADISQRNQKTIVTLFKGSMDAISREAQTAALMTGDDQLAIETMRQKATAFYKETVATIRAVYLETIGEPTESTRGADRFVHTPMPVEQDHSANLVHTMNNNRNGQDDEHAPLSSFEAAPPVYNFVPPPTDRASMASEELATYQAWGMDAADVFCVDENNEKSGDYDAAVPVDLLRAEFKGGGGGFEIYDRKKLTMTIRPIMREGHFIIQADDIDAATAETLKPYGLIKQTSGNPRGLQAMLPVRGDEDEIDALIGQLKEGFGAGILWRKNGPTRLSGFKNFKTRYAPDYPTVAVMHGDETVMIRLAYDLARQLRLPEKANTPAKGGCVRSFVLSDASKVWPMPDYNLFARRGTKSRSEIDYAWAATALKRGHSIEAVQDALDRQSLKAEMLKGAARSSYVKRTVRAAARDVGVL